jgi:hypothetical protein
LMALYSLILQMVVFDGVVNLQFGPHHTIWDQNYHKGPADRVSAFSIADISLTCLNPRSLDLPEIVT